MSARPRIRHARPVGEVLATETSSATLTASDAEPFVHYRDRSEAGRVLAGWLEPIVGAEPAVVAAAAGGVPVGAEVAEALGGQLDVLFVHGLALPQYPGRRLGAVAEDGTTVLDSQLVMRLHVALRELDEAIERERRRAALRGAACRGARPLQDLAGRSVVVVDDGLDSAAVAAAAVRSVRLSEPASIVVAVPVASRSALRRLAADADHVVAPVMPAVVGGCERWYQSFPAVSDTEVAELLRGTRSN
jgi:putative phosphoribosyl transferase